MDGEMQKRMKIGQLKRHEGLKVVYLMESTFQIWNDMRKELSREVHVMTSNEFAICNFQVVVCFGAPWFVFIKARKGCRLAMGL